MDLLPALLPFDISPEAGSAATEAELHALLSLRIAWLLAHQTELLFSLLYRMDVDEKLVHQAMDPGAATPPAEALATLVINRQKARLRTKRDTPVEDIDEDMAW